MNIAVRPSYWNSANPMTFILRNAVAKHTMLWDCHLSGQLSDADLEHEIATDPGFAAFVSDMARAGH